MFRHRRTAPRWSELRDPGQRRASARCGALAAVNLAVVPTICKGTDACNTGGVPAVIMNTAKDVRPDKPNKPYPLSVSAFTRAVNAAHGAGRKMSFGPSGSLLSRTATVRPSGAIWMHSPPLLLWVLVRHVARDRSGVFVTAIPHLPASVIR